MRWGCRPRNWGRSARESDWEMGASPAKFLFGFLFVSVVLWVIFMYVIRSNSRLKGYFSFVLIIIRLWNAVTCLIRLECSYDFLWIEMCSLVSSGKRRYAVALGMIIVFLVLLTWGNENVNPVFRRNLQLFGVIISFMCYWVSHTHMDYSAFSFYLGGSHIRFISGIFLFFGHPPVYS